MPCTIQHKVHYYQILFYLSCNNSLLLLFQEKGEGGGALVRLGQKSGTNLRAFSAEALLYCLDERSFPLQYAL